MKVFFDQTAPFYIVKEPSFDAIPVEVSEETVKIIDKIQNILGYMAFEIDKSGAPEDNAQRLADLFDESIREEIING